MAADRRGHPKGVGMDPASYKVIFDTNFLFVPLKFGVDVFDELRRLFSEKVRYIVPRIIINELEGLRQGAKPSFNKEIDYALKIVERCEILDESLRPSESVDQSLVRIAKEGGYFVATNDAELRKKLRDAGVSVILLRQRAFLEVNGFYP